MYLSLIRLNLSDHRVRRDLADCQELHRTMMSAFPQKDGPGIGARAAFEVLYRLDMGAAGEAPSLLVQSELAPDWSRLRDSGYCAGDKTGKPAAVCKDIAEAYAGLQGGQVLRFRLAANPTKKTGTTSKAQRLAGMPKSNGRREALVAESDQLSWLRRKGDQLGFELLGATVTPVAEDGQRQKKLLHFRGVVYEGHLRVTDANRFREALASGIGPGKAYGFGLMSIARG